MATAYTGSMNEALTSGLSDGSVRCFNPNRGGVVEPTTQLRRESLPYDSYGARCGSDVRPDMAHVLPPQHNDPSPL